MNCRYKWGRHVYVKLTRNDYLTLCEVKVYGRYEAPRSVNTVSCSYKKARYVWVKMPRNEWLTLCEVKVYGRYDIRHANRPVEIARGKPTAQSSEGWSGRPSRAVDGNTNQAYGRGTCTHTQVSKPWWKVDLKGTYEIEKVVIWNRSDCCQNRLREASISVGHKKCGAIGGAASVNHVSCRYQTGNVVTVALPRNDYLTLCEVKVYGRKAAKQVKGSGLPQPVQLVSQGRPSHQSSEGWSGRPSRAVDGNANQRYGGGSCTHTGHHHAWWRVDLQRHYEIQKVIIWNRSDCCAGRLNGARVFVDHQHIGNCGAGGTSTINGHFKKGRNVWVKMPRRDYLTLCEVRVYGRRY